MFCGRNRYSISGSAKCAAGNQTNNPERAFSSGDVAFLQEIKCHVKYSDPDKIFQYAGLVDLLQKFGIKVRAIQCRVQGSDMG